MKLPLNALRVFDVTGKLQSVLAASDELCITPAAVSQQIRLLEEFLGVRLFNREHRRIVLTEAGAQYHADISRSFADLQRATQSITRYQDNKTFNIRAPHTIALRWLLPKLASLHMSHPTIEVKLHTSLAQPDFDREDLDAGIMLGDGSWKGVEVWKLMSNHISPVCTPEKARQLRSPTDLKHETLLHTLARPDDWQLWFQAAQINNIDTSRGMRYQSSALAYQAAVEGYGVAIAQRTMVERELSEGRLVTPFDLWVDLGDQTYYFLLPPDGYKRRSPELEDFRNWIRSLSVD